MRIKTLLNILGALLTILGISMVIPILISFGYDESDMNGFLFSSLISIGIGFPIWLSTRHSRSLTNRDGFAIVTFSWIATAVVGALPFYFSGAIPNVTDAFFESMSGVTTTGASIIGNIEINSNLDHRIAMSFLCLGLVTEKSIIVRDTETINSSFPFFMDKMNDIGAKLNLI